MHAKNRLLSNQLNPRIVKNPMAPKDKPLGLQKEVDRRERLGKLYVLVADRDHRTASLVQRLLFSFGFRHMDVTTNGESALALLKSRSYDIIITEWNMIPLDGVGLVKAIRGAKAEDRMPRDIPILMLTAQADLNSVESARDAGITEFVAKPFSAKTISNRIIQIIDNPRAFVEAPEFIGPCRRRRREEAPKGRDKREGKSGGRTLPPNLTMQKQLGDVRAAEIITDKIVAEAQNELLRAEGDFLEWAKNDIKRLERAYVAVEENPRNAAARSALLDAAYAIKSQAGIFGYPLGTEVAALLVDYLNHERSFTKKSMVVLAKHIEAISVIFRQKIKETGQGIAMDMLHSLRQLIQKMG